MKKSRIIYRFILQHRGRFLLALLTSAAASTTTILVPLSIGKFYALVFGLQGTRSRILDFLPGSFFRTVPQFIGFFMLLVLMYLILNFTQRYIIGTLGELFVARLREQLFEHQLKLDYRIYQQKGIGKYLLRYSGDLRSIQNYLTKGLIGFSVDTLLVSLMVYVLALIAPQVALVCIGSMLIISLFILLANRFLHRITSLRRNRRSMLLSFVNQRLQAVATIKAFNRQKPEMSKFIKRSDKLYNSGIEYHRISSFLHAMVPALLYFMMGGIMWITYSMSQQGVGIPQESLLIAFLLLVTSLPVLRRLLRVNIVWELGKISFAKLIRVLELPESERHESADLHLEEASISLESVGLQFDDNDILKNVNKEWKGFGLHLVKGKTGSGKSSLIRLLLGIYPISSGKVRISGQDTTNLNIKSIRKHISIASEEYPLLGRTVFEAISYSRKERKRAAAKRVLDSVQKHLPETMKLDLDDRIAGSGNGISKGQATILYLTRALLTRKPILLLDEPFAQLDADLQVHIETLLNKLRKKRLIICFMRTSTSTDLKFDSTFSLGDANSPVIRSIQKSA